jgi:NADH-quinone oxidoreductase subunit J
MLVESVLFWIFAAGVVLAGAQVVFRRNPIHGALALVGCFFFLAGVYVLLAAHLIAILQVMVYAGAVMVLFVFVIMLLNLRDEELGEPRMTAFKGLGLVGVLVAVGLLSFRALGAAYASFPRGRGLDLAGTLIGLDGFGTLKAVGRAIYLHSVLAFEVTSLLLLVAVVGAVVVAKGKI